MNICIIEDQPKFKVQEAINYLKEKKIKFNYIIFKNSSSALQYLMTNLSNINLIILDLGLPKLDNGIYYNKYEGLFILNKILSKTKKIPIIINSTTAIHTEDCTSEKEYFKNLSPAIVEHIDRLTGYYLYEFIKIYLDDKIEFL